MQMVRAWLWLLALLVCAMIIVGGATRLTDSGLSITEWQLITGFIPPLNEAQWMAAFEKYKQIPEFKIVNSDMDLSGFKFIYWWEWGHRFLGRMIGVAFLLPYLFFFWRGLIGSNLNKNLIMIFVLGGLQGALGWYMVASGLVERVDVSQYRLAAHLGVAFLILAAILWTVRSLNVSNYRTPNSRALFMAGFLVVLIFLQILLGALVAGTDAGFTYNTWPLMDGDFIPNSLFVMDPWIANIFENVQTIQFDHRMLAYLVWCLIVFHAYRMAAGTNRYAGEALWLAGIATLQVALGIWALLAAVPLSLGVFHQAGAILLFAMAVVHWHNLFGHERLGPGGSPSPNDDLEPLRH
ncbi:MAG: COX15/CtaA family protein [Fimbriimonadaceae bacterium]|nr:COX15/CtaA family protein [Alphaproteobacteria bacterium]